MSLCNPDVAVMQSLEYPLVPVIQACRTIARLIIWTAFRYESSYNSNKFSHWREAVKKSLSSLTGEVFYEWSTITCFRGHDQVMSHLFRAPLFVHYPSTFDPNGPWCSKFELRVDDPSSAALSKVYLCFLSSWSPSAVFVVNVFSGARCSLNKYCHWSWLRQPLSVIFLGFIPTTASARTICSVVPSDHWKILNSSRLCFQSVSVDDVSLKFYDVMGRNR